MLVWVGMWRPTPGESSSKANPIGAGGRLSQLSLVGARRGCVVSYPADAVPVCLGVCVFLLPMLGDAQVPVLVRARVRAYASACTRTRLRTCDA